MKDSLLIILVFGVGLPLTIVLFYLLSNFIDENKKQEDVKE